MDSRPESEFGPSKKPSPEVNGPSKPGLPKPMRPKVILPTKRDSSGDFPGPEESRRSSGRAQASELPGQNFPDGEPQLKSGLRSQRPSSRQATSDSFQRPISISNDPRVAPPVRLANCDAVTARRDNRPNDESSGMGGLYFLLASAALMFGIWFIGPRLVEEYHYAATLGRARAEFENAVEQLEQKPLANVSYAYQLVAERIRPSVVSVNAVKSRREGSGLGSGVIMSTDGYILTNAHVLEDATEFWVQLHDRRTFKARIIGTDAVSDLALLKIDAPKLTPATWGDSEKVSVGSIVWAIGSPYGFRQTVTSGIISGKDRSGDQLHPTQSLLQTDAAVNPGNSGGPLVDAQGLVIGINTSIFGETFQGISFAVPSSTAKFVYQQLAENGRVTRGFLGVRPQEVDHRDAQRMQLPDLDGAKLNSVLPGSPAHQAGIRAGDIIRSWDGVDVTEYKHLFRLAEMTRPESRVKVCLLRNGQEHFTEVTVGRLPDLGPQFLRRRKPVSGK